MPKLAMVTTQLTEAFLIVRTLLLLLGGTRLRLLRMSVHTLSVLLVTMAIFFEKLTYGDLLLNIHVKVLTRIALPAHFARDCIENEPLGRGIAFDMLPIEVWYIAMLLPDFECFFRAYVSHIG